jgi:hypothetical protein
MSGRGRRRGILEEAMVEKWKRKRDKIKGGENGEGEGREGGKKERNIIGPF